MRETLIDALYLLALVNPVSKIAVLSAFASPEDRRLMPRVAVESTAIAAALLLVFAIAGNFVLHDIFRVDLYSLRVAGGTVLFWFGFKALTRGAFYETDTKDHFVDLAIVPLASPMIAGPATIAALLTLSIEHGYLVSISAMLLAVAANLLFMLSAPYIGSFLARFHLMGALIRLTGLVVATLAVQMVTDGLGSWLTTVVPRN